MLATKNAIVPATSVEQYAVAAVIPNNLPAPSDNAAIPLTTKPMIISGMIKLKNSPNKLASVIKTLNKPVGIKLALPRPIPIIMAMISLETKPSLNFFFSIFYPLFNLFLFPKKTQSQLIF